MNPKLLPPNYTTNKSTPGWWGGTQAFSGNLWGTFKLWDNSEVADNFENLRAEGRGILSSGYFAFGTSFGENIGVGTLTSAYEGRNAAGEKLSPGGRALYAVGGLGELALNVVGLKGAVVSARAAPQAARVALRNGTRAYQGAKAALQTGWKQLIDWRTARRAVDGKLDEALEQLGKTADNTLKEVADDFAKPVTAKSRVSLGIEDHLDDFSRNHGADSWKQWSSDPSKWKSQFYDYLNDPNTEVLFNLDGVNVWEGVSRASRKAGGATDWELLQIRSNPEWWSRIKWIKDGVEVLNPFK